MSVRVAVVQATPVVLDAEARVEKACDLIGEAGAERRPHHRAARGASSPSTPARAGRTAARPSAARAPRCTGAYGPGRLTCPGPLTERLGAAARRAGHGSRSASTSATRPGRGRSGTPWSGSRPTARLAGKHRKLMPTLHERVFHGMGAGRRPRRARVRARAPRRAALLGELHARGAPGAAPPGASTSTSRRRPTTATSGWRRCGPSPSRPAPSCCRRCSTCRKTAFPDDFPLADEIAAGPDELLQGASLIADPWGNLLAGPVSGGRRSSTPTATPARSSPRGGCSTPPGTTAARTWRSVLVAPGQALRELAQRVPARVVSTTRSRRRPRCGRRRRSGRGRRSPRGRGRVAGTASAIASRVQPARSRLCSST